LHPFPKTIRRRSIRHGPFPSLWSAAHVAGRGRSRQKKTMRELPADPAFSPRGEIGADGAVGDPEQGGKHGEKKKNHSRRDGLRSRGAYVPRRFGAGDGSRQRRAGAYSPRGDRGRRERAKVRRFAISGPGADQGGRGRRQTGVGKARGRRGANFHDARGGPSGGFHGNIITRTKTSDDVCFANCDLSG